MHSLAAANIIAREARHFLLLGIVALVAAVIPPQNLYLTLVGTAALGAAAALAIVRRRFLPKLP